MDVHILRRASLSRVIPKQLDHCTVKNVIVCICKMTSLNQPGITLYTVMPVWLRISMTVFCFSLILFASAQKEKQDLKLGSRFGWQKTRSPPLKLNFPNSEWFTYCERSNCLSYVLFPRHKRRKSWRCTYYDAKFSLYLYICNRFPVTDIDKWNNILDSSHFSSLRTDNSDSLISLLTCWTQAGWDQARNSVQ